MKANSIGPRWRVPKLTGVLLRRSPMPSGTCSS